MSLLTNFRSPPKNSHSRYGHPTPRFAPVQSSRSRPKCLSAKWRNEPMARETRRCLSAGEPTIRPAGHPERTRSFSRLADTQHSRGSWLARMLALASQKCWSLFSWANRGLRSPVRHVAPVLAARAIMLATALQIDRRGIRILRPYRPGSAADTRNRRRRRWRGRIGDGLRRRRRRGWGRSK